MIPPLLPTGATLLLATGIGIGTTVLLVARARLHPFIALLCGAFLVGLIAGLPMARITEAIHKGAGDILAGTGLVVALGLSLGAMLQLSNGASSLAQACLRLVSESAAPWACLAMAMLVGLPLFFETGLVLLLPIVAAVASRLGDGQASDGRKLQLMLSAVAGLSVVHALVPPHPGPMMAINALGAPLGRTMLWGLALAIPTGLLAGPILARATTRGVAMASPMMHAPLPDAPPPGHGRVLLVVLMPVVLIALGQAPALLPGAAMGKALAAVSDPVAALLLTNLAALPLLFGRRMIEAGVQKAIWAQAMEPAGAILLAIAAGGALKQVLVSAGLSQWLAHLATQGHVPPILLAWLIAVGIRLATGSATVATITTAGVMPAIIAATGVDPVWMVLAIGAGSVFFSHVNDPGFWLVRGYLGLSTPDTFRTWSLLETAISVIGLALILLASALA